MNQNRIIKLVVLLLAALIILTVSISAAQTPTPMVVDDNLVSVQQANLIWQKTYGGAADDRAFYTLPVGDGYLVVGSTKSIVQNATAGWALMLDRAGDAVWNRTYLEGSGTEIRLALPLSDGFLLVGNEFLPQGDVNGYVTKIDSEGAQIWNITVGEDKVDKLFSATATQDGFVLFGLTYSYGSGESDVWAVKIDGNGNVIWNRAYTSTAETAARTGMLAPDGDYMVAGYTDPAGASNYDFLLMKIDSSGDLVWNETYGGVGNQKAYAMTKASDGYIMVGDTESPTTDIDAWVVKVDWNGTMLWSKEVGGKNADSPSYIAPSKDGNYLVAGFTFSFGAGFRDFWLFKINDSGDVMWTCTQGDAGYQEAYGVVEADENQYVMTGWTDPLGQPALVGKATYDFNVIKISAPQNNIGFSGVQFIIYTLVVIGLLVAALLLVSKLRHKPALKQTS